jgi:hypothetical protein
MNADAANVPTGKFVMIATTDPTSAENARLYGKNSAGGFTFLSDLDQASAQAWADWLNNQKPLIEAATAYANEKGSYANTQGDYAKQQGDYAKDEGDYAKTQGDYAKTQGEAALAAKKASGARLGNPSNIAVAGELGRCVQTEAADEFVANLAPIIRAIRSHQVDATHWPSGDERGHPSHLLPGDPASPPDHCLFTIPAAGFCRCNPRQVGAALLCSKGNIAGRGFAELVHKVPHHGE